MKLHIIGVAVKHKDLTICLPKPNRHSDCITYAIKVLNLKAPISSMDQGFYLSNGVYLNRKQAFVYIKGTNQKLRNQLLTNELYSENLW